MTDKTYTQADIDKITADTDSRMEAMDAKVKEAVDEAKKAKAEARKLKEIDPADLAALEADNEKLKAELATAQKTAKEATASAEKAVKALEAESAVTHRLVAENGLVAALTANGISDPAYLEAAKAMHLGAVKIVAEGEGRAAMYGDKPLLDAIKEWAAGETGKKFVSAPANGGGGAPGGNRSQGTGKQMTSAESLALQPKARAAFFAEGGILSDA